MTSQALARAIDIPRTLQPQAQSRVVASSVACPVKRRGCYCENHNPISVAQSETLQHARLGYANPLECHEGRYAPPQLLHYTAAEARLARRARRCSRCSNRDIGAARAAREAVAWSSRLPEPNGVPRGSPLPSAAHPLLRVLPRWRYECSATAAVEWAAAAARLKEPSVAPLERP